MDAFLINTGIQFSNVNSLPLNKNKYLINFLYKRYTLGEKKFEKCLSIFCITNFCKELSESTSSSSPLSSSFSSSLSSLLSSSLSSAVVVVKRNALYSHSASLPTSPPNSVLL